MGRLFGTDGIRGIVNKNLNSYLALKVGLATGSFFKEINDKKPLFIVGTDTRISKDMLSQSIMSGLTSSGANVIDLGVIPTPAVAYLVHKYNANAGIMITASHNPANYNGIKIFNGDGYKLSDEVEEEIENRIAKLDKNIDLYNVSYQELGQKIVGYDPAHAYSEYLISIGNDLSNTKVTLDLANGASSYIAFDIFSSLGAEVSVLSNQPNGLNVNDKCGSTNMNYLQLANKGNSSVAFAFDGDADRCLALDENGELVDGDELLAIIAKYMKDNGTLKQGNNTLVGTIMSNFGLKQFCKKEHINFVDTKVGDRYVLEAMLLDGYLIGGEQSGHIIFNEYATTGDGMLTAIMILKIIKDTNMPLYELKKVMKKYPQKLDNLEVTNQQKIRFSNDIALKQQIDEENKQLGDEGRVLVRASGTEALIRVMAEAKTIDQASSLVLKYKNIVSTKYN